MDFLKNAWNWIDGHKTIIFGSIIILLQSPLALNYLSLEVIETALMIITPLGVASLGHHIKKAVTSKKDIP